MKTRSDEMEASQVIWICEDVMIERQADRGRLTMTEAARQAGCPAIKLSIESANICAQTPPFCYADIIVVAWGTRAFSDALRPVMRPEGFFCSRESQEYDLYAPHLGEMMLNAAYEIVPWSDVIERSKTHAVFTKPAVNSKRFTGMVLNPANRDEKLLSCLHVADDVPCIVAPVRPEIDGEFRYVIVDGKVIDGSCYRWDGKLDVRSDTLAIADKLAAKVAALSWRPEDVFVCDVAVTKDREQAFVVELNPFASSGMYACDLVAVAKAVTEHLRK